MARQAKFVDGAAEPEDWFFSANTGYLFVLTDYLAQIA
jgi:hypothetical protein